MIDLITLMNDLLLLGTHDFFGLNHYTTALAENYDRGTEWPGWDFDRDIQEHVDPSWPL